MKALVFCGLSNKKLESKIKTLSFINNIKSIDVIRDIKGSNLKKVKYHPTSKILSKNKLIRNIVRLFKLFYYSLKLRPNFILTFYFVPYGVMGVLCSKMSRIPVISALIGSDLDTQIKSRLGWFYMAFLKMSNIVLVRGTNSKKYLIARGINSKKIVIMPNYLDLKNFIPKKINKEFDIIYVGRISSEKNIDFMLKVVAEIKKKKKDVKMAVLGDENPRSKDQLKNKLILLAKDLNIENNISFLGHKNNVEDYLNKSRILLLSSSHEGLPAVLVEAMACGVVPIANEVGEISDLLQHNSNGIIIEKLNILSYADAVFLLLNNTGFYNKLSHNSIKVKENYSLKILSDKWNHILSFIR